MKKLHFPILLACLILVLFSCKDSTSSTSETTILHPNEETIAMAENVGVYDVLKDPAYVQQVKELDLKCPNLNDPRIPFEDRELAMDAWVALNQNIGQHLLTKEFDWGTTAETVKIWHRFYFNKDGSINSYYYNIMDKSINEDTREAYGKRVSEIIQEHRIGFELDSAFAQCGKMVFQVL